MQLAAVDPKKAQQQMTHPCDDHMLEEPQQIEASCLMKTVDSATQLTAPANEMYPACDASTQTPMNWRMRGTQTFGRSWSRGKTHPSEYQGRRQPEKTGVEKGGRLGAKPPEKFFRDHALQILGKRGKRPLKHF